jgi:hypothetical protein
VNQVRSAKHAEAVRHAQPGLETQAGLPVAALPVAQPGQQAPAVLPGHDLQPPDAG